MGKAKLFEKCHVGTKDLIEQYIDEVVYDLNYLSTVEVPGMSSQVDAPPYSAM
jgi:TAG lipase/steryl ester hydrolase/phospholipase A2/LPA acyltransferase